MPFAMQADLLSMSYRAHLMTDYGLWGIEVGQLFSHYLYALNLFFMKGMAYLTGIFPTDFSQIFIEPALYGRVLDQQLVVLVIGSLSLKILKLIALFSF